MTGHRPFRELTALVPAKARARIAAMRDEMTLSELRHARAMSQDDVAASLSVQQPAVAKLERRTDMHISSLRRYVEALGGKLEITARFSDASVSIGSLAERNDASLSDPV